jgi:hypothetical protein
MTNDWIDEFGEEFGSAKRNLRWMMVDDQASKELVEV